MAQTCIGIISIILYIGDVLKKYKDWGCVAG